MGDVNNSNGTEGYFGNEGGGDATLQTDKQVTGGGAENGPRARIDRPLLSKHSYSLYFNFQG